VERLVREVASSGWKPDWSTLRAVTRTVELESTSGTFDTAVVEFEQEIDAKSARGRGERGGRRVKSEAPQEEMYLHWTGNDDVGVQKLDENAGGPAILQLTNDPSSEISMGGLCGPIADEITIYEVSDGNVISASTTAESSSYPAAHDRDVTATSGEYCEIHVKIFEKDSADGGSCWDVSCALLSVIRAGVTALGCLSTAGLVCILGAGVSYGSILDCLVCEVRYEGTAEVEKDYLEEITSGRDCDRSGAPENWCQPCDFFTSNKPFVSNTCEFEDIPTREDYNYAQC